MAKGAWKTRKFEEKLTGMRHAGLMVNGAHEAAAALVKPGVTTAQIDQVIDEYIVSRGGVPLFKGVQPDSSTMPFPASSCISVNDAVVHGIPGAYPLKEGDVVSIDIGVKLDGWCGDAAVTYPVGAIHPTAKKLLDITEGVLALAIELVARHHRWSQVARGMEQYVHEAGFSVVEGLVGHSIGREMWEGLQLPNYYTKEYERKGDFRLEPGLVLAIEPMINAGGKDVLLLDDHWTIVTRDGSPSAHFEHTIALTEDGPEVLTANREGTGWAIVQAPV